MYLDGVHVYNTTDSQAMLRSLESQCKRSLLTWECPNTIKQLARGNKVTLLWIPGHFGVGGEEKANEFLKVHQTVGSEPVCGFGNDQYKAEVQQW